MNTFIYKLGSVPYLNARPLTDWFTETEEGRAVGASVEFILPSQLAPRLEPGDLSTSIQDPNFNYIKERFIALKLSNI